MSSTEAEDRFVWVDVENFGLEADTDHIIELGFTITNLHLEIQDSVSWLVWSAAHGRRYEAQKANVDLGTGPAGEPIVWKMHTDSGLYYLASGEGNSPAWVGDEACLWLKDKGITGQDPMCGSSVQFDRLMLEAQYPMVHELFHYRNVDVSTVKELCRRFNPEVFASMNRYVHDRKKHRVIPDLEDSIAEMKYYADNFLFLYDQAY